MFDQLKSVLPGQLQNVDATQLASAASEHIGQLPHDELIDHVQTAVGNLQQQNPQLAGQLQSLVQQVASNPSGFKDAVTQFIASNPQVLQSFAPEFAQGLLAKL